MTVSDNTLNSDARKTRAGSCSVRHGRLWEVLGAQAAELERLAAVEQDLVGLDHGEGAARFVGPGLGYKRMYTSVPEGIGSESFLELRRRWLGPFTRSCRFAAQVPSSTCRSWCAGLCLGRCRSLVVVAHLVGWGSQPHLRRPRVDRCLPCEEGFLMQVSGAAALGRRWLDRRLRRPSGDRCLPRLARVREACLFHGFLRSGCRGVVE